MQRQLTKSQGQLSLTNFKSSMPNSLEQQTQESLNSRSSHFSTQTNFFKQSSSQTQKKQQLQEQNQFINESPHYGSIYNFNQTKANKNDNSFTYDPMSKTSQDFSKIGFSDLKEELFRKSNKIQQILNSSAKRIQTRSVSPFSQTVTSKFVPNSTFKHKQPLDSPPKSADNEQEIKEILAIKLQELEKLKKQNNKNTNQAGRSNIDKSQLEQEKKTQESAQSKTLTKNKSQQSQLSQPKTVSDYIVSQNPQQPMLFLSQQIAKFKEKGKIQSQQLRKKFQALQEYEKEKEEQQKMNKSLEKEISKKQKIQLFTKSIKNSGQQHQSESKKLQLQDFESSNLRKEIIELQEQQNKDQKEIHSLKNALLKEKLLVTALREDNSNLKQNKIQLQDQLDCQKFSDTSSSISHTPNKKILEEKRKVAHFKELYQQINSQLKEIKKENDRLQNQIKEITQQTTKQKQENQQKSLKLEHYQLKNEQLQAKINQDQDQINRLNDNYQKVQKELDSYQKQQKAKQRELQQQISDLQYQNQSLAATNKDLKKKNKDLVNDMQNKIVEIVQQSEQKIEQQFSIINQRLQEKEQNIENLNVLVKQKLQNDLQSLLDLQEQFALDELNISQSLSTHRIYQYEQEIQNLNKTKHDLEYMIQQSREYHASKIEELENDILAISIEKNQIINEYKQLQEQNCQLNLTITQLQQELNQKNNQIVQLKSGGQKVQDLKKDQNLQQKNLEDQNRNLQSEKEGIEKELIAVQLQATQQIQELEAKLEDMSEQYSNLIIELSSFTLQLPEAQQMT